MRRPCTMVCRAHGRETGKPEREKSMKEKHGNVADTEERAAIKAVLFRNAIIDGNVEVATTLRPELAREEILRRIAEEKKRGSAR